MREALLLIRPAPMPGDRLSSVLGAALDGRATEEICTAQAVSYTHLNLAASVYLENDLEMLRRSYEKLF